MIFRKKDRLVGLDIGSSLIKVAALKHSSKGYELRKLGMAQPEPGAIMDGRIIDKQSLANTIRSLFKSLKIHEKNVAISAGGHSMLIKTFNIPGSSDAKELEKTIYSEASQSLPYDMDEVNIDYQVLGENKAEPSGLNVLLVAAHKDMPAEYSSLMRLAGLRLQIIDVDVFALQNAYNLLMNQNRESSTLLADIGASRMSLNIFKGDHSFMIRDIMYGTNKIVEDIAEDFEISYEEAKQALIRQNNNIDSQNHDQDQAQAQNQAQDKNRDRINEISFNIMTSWCREIIETLNEFQAGTYEAGVENIVLSGGGALIGGFKDFLLSRLDMNISIIRPFNSLIIKKKKFSTSFLSKAAPWAGIAIGLALRKVNDK